MESSEFSKLLRRVASLPATTSATLIAGDRLGRFEIVRELGRGGFGVVYEARDTDLGRHVGIKTLRIAADERARFSDEATTAARLNHPNIVTLFDHGMHDGTPYLVLELLEGRTLRRQLLAGPLPASQVRDLGVQLARALAHAHGAGVIHRDLKPENVFVRDDGLIKLLDFGISWARPSSAAGTSGTRGYMAPEQASGEPHDARVDVYALGVVLFEATTGARPTEPLDLSHVPDELAPVIERALAPEPDARPSAHELLALLADRTTAERAQPYRWLEAFHEDDAGWFFGRDREIARLRLLLDTRAVVVLAGPSGAGKSSLVRAGLVPRLREEQWRVVTLRAGDRAVDELVGRLGANGEWRSHPGRLGDHLRRDLREQRLLVFVDQAEQLLAWPAVDRDPFLAALCAAADDVEGPIRLVLAVRDDFMAQLARAEALRGLLGRSLLLLGPPDAEQLGYALVEPARRLGFSFEDGLADEVIGALGGEPAPLPILQLVASRLWDSRDVATRTIPRRALARLGGMTGVLAHHADEVLRALAPEQRALARTMVTALVTPEGTRRAVERPRLVDPPGAEPVLEHLIRGRLLTGGEQIELAHESLVTGWSELTAWLEDDASRVKLRDRIAAAALHWIERGRPRDLLWRGTALADATTVVDQISGRDREFVVAALRRARARRRLALGVAGASLVVAVVAGIVAARAARAAARANEAARIERVVHRAELADDPVVGALLLAELGDVEPPGGTAAALRVGAQPVPIALLRGHVAPIRTVQISHDGTRVLTCGNDRCQVAAIDGRGTPQVFPPGMTGAFTSDDSGVVIARRTSSSTSEISWISLIGRPTRLLHLDALVNGVAVVTGGRVVIGTALGEALRWDGERTEVLVRFGGTGKTGRGVQSFYRHPDGRLLITGHHQAVVVGGARPPLILEHPEDRIWWGHMLSDGRIVTMADATLYLWPADGSAPTVLAKDGPNSLQSSRPFVMPDDRIGYVTDSGRTVILSPSGAPPITLEPAERLGIAKALALADGRIASIDLLGQTLIESVTNERVWLRGSGVPATNIAATPDGRTVITAGDDGIARVWRIDAAPAVHYLRGHRDEVADLRFSRDGRRVLSVSADGTARTWDVARAAPLRVLPHEQPVHCGTWIGDDSIFTASDDGLRIYDGDRMRVRLAPPVKPGIILENATHCGDISPDGRFAVAATYHGAYLFNVATGAVREVGNWGLVAPQGNAYGYLHVVFSPDGRSLAGSVQWDQVYVWPVTGGTARGTLAANRDPSAFFRPVNVHRVRFFPDGEHVVTADRGGAIRFWSRDGREDARLARRGGTDARPSGDGQRIAIAGMTGAIETIEPGGERLVLPGDGRAYTEAVELGPDGRRAVTGDITGMIRLWWITWPDLVKRLRTATTACLSVDRRALLLEEAREVARARFAACERRSGRG